MACFSNRYSFRRLGYPVKIVGFVGRPLSEMQQIVEQLESIEYYGSNYKNGKMIDGFEFGGISRASIDDWQKLFSLHFDVFGLIPQGLAIDINTLNKKI